ncbi:hypothetical protein OESDEN_02984 [Oesophagostomum dentatum]|uniref:Uncharacterized protein n=1 Tax=Oesophagostomum dentatum TaxID=61180 RepID=A0A0B1THM2_OESDE|nr:hypothetical protein OESDEN_02984 [Oesophagostomum dentatum]
MYAIFTLLCIWALVDADSFIGVVIKELVVSTEEMEMEKSHPEMASKMIEFSCPTDCCIFGNHVSSVLLSDVLVARRCTQVSNFLRADIFKNFPCCECRISRENQIV